MDRWMVYNFVKLLNDFSPDISLSSSKLYLFIVMLDIGQKAALKETILPRVYLWLPRIFEGIF